MKDEDMAEPPSAEPLGTCQRCGWTQPLFTTNDARRASRGRRRFRRVCHDCELDLHGIATSGAGSQRMLLGLPGRTARQW